MTGKIYLIQNKVSNKVYIGATIQKLSDRFDSHKYNINQTKAKIIYDESPETTYITLLEECNNDIMEEREKFYIQKYKENCVNLYGTTEDGMIHCEKCNNKIHERGYGKHIKTCGIEHRCACGARLSTASKLRRHFAESCKLNTEKEVFNCDKCEYTTSTKDNLTRHKKICRLKCDHCEETFTNNIDRQNHEQNYHNNPSKKN